MDKYTAAEEGFKRGYEKGYADGKKDAEDEILILKQKRANIFEILDAYKRGLSNALKWIPVSERLPENFISVLVHIPDMNPCPAVMEAYRFDDGWVTKMAAFDINCATHWMEMPEPPEEDE